MSQRPQTGQRQSAALPAMAKPADAIQAMLERIQPVETTKTKFDLQAVSHRVLAQDILADRDSPAADVSAMDGYALAFDTLDTQVTEQTLTVAFEVETGQPPATTPAAIPVKQAARIFTGGVVPEGADIIIPREQVNELKEESKDPIGQYTASIMINHQSNPFKRGQFIRYQGENAKRGSVLLQRGALLTPPCCLTLASTATNELDLYRCVRVALLVTGNEVQSTPSSGAAVRDSNGPAIGSLLAQHPWCELLAIKHLGDDYEQTKKTIDDLTHSADLLITTGGISMGDHDYIPPALVELGAEVIYHHLAMRPGKPNLGAVMSTGVPVVSLPGNPVSALVGAVVLAGPLLRKLAGFKDIEHRLRVTVDETQAQYFENTAASARRLWHYRLGQMSQNGMVEPLASKSSGDVAAMGLAGGFFAMPPEKEAGVWGNADERMMRDWFEWRLD